MEYIKISENEMEVTKEVPIVEPTKTTYSLDFLKEQELQILKQMNEYIDDRKKELEEVRMLINQAEELGLKMKLETESNKLEESGVLAK